MVRWQHPSRSSMAEGGYPRTCGSERPTTTTTTTTPAPPQQQQQYPPRLGFERIRRLETGGDNVTRVHASFRKISSWLDKNTDFSDLGKATSGFLSTHPNALCITWKMVAFPGPLIVSQVLESHLAGAVQVRVRAWN
jgi:hypothetical protein